MKTLGLAFALASGVILFLVIALCVLGSMADRRHERQLRRALREEDRCRNCGELPDECPCEYFLALLN